MEDKRFTAVADAENEASSDYVCDEKSEGVDNIDNVDNADNNVDADIEESYSFIKELPVSPIRKANIPTEERVFDEPLPEPEPTIVNTGRKKSSFIASVCVMAGLVTVLGVAAFFGIKTFFAKDDAQKGDEFNYEDKSDPSGGGSGGRNGGSGGSGSQNGTSGGSGGQNNDSGNSSDDPSGAMLSPSGMASETAGEQGDVSSQNGNYTVVSSKEMRGVWVSTVYRLDYPSAAGLSSAQLARELDSILENCAKTGFNAIFFQVRPSADALYKSDIFPWSAFVSGTQGEAPDDGFDSLAYLLSKAPEYDIDIHAWINPVRVTTGSATAPAHDVTLLAPDHPARLHPEYVIPYADGKLYFDLGNPEVRSLIVSGIKELCENYPDLAGIHCDDYFYPYPVSGADFNDEASYEKYGSVLTLENWRRNNVNLLVKQAYDTVKAADSSMRFGISPFGIWANSGKDTYVDGSNTAGLESYFSLYCDTIAWVNGGYVDYIVPQIYWNFTHSKAPYDDVARWWNAQLDGKGVDLYIGHNIFNTEYYGINEFPMQMEYARSLGSYRGSVFFRYKGITEEYPQLVQILGDTFSTVGETQKLFNVGAQLHITYPASTLTTYATDYIFGISDPTKPLYVNGEKVSRSRDGYFSLHPDFAFGDNVFEFVCGDEKLTYTIKRVSSIPSTASNTPEVMEKFEILSASPDKPLWLIPGDTVSVSCDAPAGSTVYALLGDYRIELQPQKYGADKAENYRETYKGNIKIDEVLAAPGEMKDLGTLTVYAEKNGNTATKQLTEIKQMGGDVLVYAKVKNDYSYLKNSVSSSFYNDPLPQSVGAKDYITAFVKGYYRLRCGYYISEDNVEVVVGEALAQNSILDVTVAPNISDNTNNLANFTDIRFSVVDNVPVNAYIQNGRVYATFYNTDPSSIPEVKLERNPMISSGYGFDNDGRVTYEFKLRNMENYYGYDIIHEDGSTILRLHNPQALADGDKPLSGKTIVVDAGHGGTDRGAQGPTQAGSGLNEKDLNLSIALALRDELTKLGANVVMIREDDSTVTLEERIEFLSDIIPDMMISVHHNSVGNTVDPADALGYQGFYSDDAGSMLAAAVSDTVSDMLSRRQRKTMYQALAVARNHRFPSTLCEMSFISNTEEFQWTITDGSYERSAKARADGVIEFYSRQAKYISY